jgi:NAD(P)-dependent dehydrogenase (short-subunit alcohol dehydrogenase family)
LIKPDFARALWEDEAMLKERMVTTPLRRIGDPDEIAGAAVSWFVKQAHTSQVKAWWLMVV